MIYTEMTNKAIKLCFKAHKKQNDKGDLPYVFHPFHLADQMETQDETCVALLHDVMEDTKIQYEKIAECGFSQDVLDALVLLTHKEGTPYLEYVRQLSGNPIAARVKLADLRHNSTPGRLKVIKDEDRERLQKYLKAQAILTEGRPDFEEMTLSFQYEIPPINFTAKSAAEKTDTQAAGNEDIQGEAKTQPAMLTLVLASDGSVRRYVLRLPSEEKEREYRELCPLLEDLERYGYSAASAVSCLQKHAN